MLNVYEKNKWYNHTSSMYTQHKKVTTDPSSPTTPYHKHHLFIRVLKDNFSATQYERDTLVHCEQSFRFLCLLPPSVLLLLTPRESDRWLFC